MRIHTRTQICTPKIDTRIMRVRKFFVAFFFFLPPRDAAPLLWHSRGYEIIFALLILASHKLRRMEFYRRPEHRSALIASRFHFQPRYFQTASSIYASDFPRNRWYLFAPSRVFICRAGKSWNISHKCLSKPLNKPLILHLVNHNVSVNEERAECELKRISLMYWQMLFYKCG